MKFFKSSWIVVHSDNYFISIYNVYSYPFKVKIVFLSFLTRTE